MPSTSTGYQPRMITRGQPSSSGQLETFSSGCKLNMKVDSEIEMESGSTMNVESGAVFNIAGKQQVKSGGELELESGSTMNVESGGSLSVNSGGILKFAVTAQSTAVPSMPRDGISVLSSAVAAAAKYTLSGVPIAGIRKTIISYSTLAATIRGASVVGQVTFSGSTVPKAFSIVLTPTSKYQIIGSPVELIGASSKRWHVIPRSTAHVAFSTACT